MKHLAKVVLAVVATHVSGLAAAVDLEITDVNGNTVTVANAQIDYTHYGMLYSPDKITTGIRARQGEGVVAAEWKSIDRLMITPRKAKNAQGIEETLLSAEITLNSGKKLNLILVEDSRDSSSEGLSGNTELGWFKIHLDKVREIRVLKPKGKK